MTYFSKVLQIALSGSPSTLSSSPSPNRTFSIDHLHLADDASVDTFLSPFRSNIRFWNSIQIGRSARVRNHHTVRAKVQNHHYCPRWSKRTAPVRSWFHQIPCSPPPIQNRGLHRNSGVGGFATGTSLIWRQTPFDSGILAPGDIDCHLFLNPVRRLSSFRVWLSPFTLLPLALGAPSLPSSPAPCLCFFVRHAHLLISIALQGPTPVPRGRDILAKCSAARSVKSAHIRRHTHELQARRPLPARKPSILHAQDGYNLCWDACARFSSRSTVLSV